MMKVVAQLGLICAVVFAANINAKQTIKLHSYYIPGLVNSETDGVLIDMLNIIQQDTNYQFSLELAPTKRVQRDFLQKRIFGYFPELEEFRPNVGNCRTDAFMKKKIIAFVRAGEPLITNVKQLEGKRVGAVSGYSYGKAIVNNPNIQLQRVTDDKINIKKLLSNRIDVIIGDIHSTVNGVKETNNIDNITFDVSQPVVALDVFFLFQNNELGQQLCKDLSVSIEKLRVSGDLYQRFGYK